MYKTIINEYIKTYKRIYKTNINGYIKPINGIKGYKKEQK